MASYGFACAIIIASTLLLPSTRIEPAKARVLNPSLLSDVSDGPCTLMVKSRGYKCEEYEVRTQDGYILSMQRIPEGRNSDKNGGKKQPILLQHGILMDGITWLLNSPEESLAFILADNGFDVWIANTRGTRWSQRHVSLDSSTRDYWAWSWDELVMHDLPSNVDFVYSKTGLKLHYVGHSLGTLVALASLSEGKLVDKLKSAVLLSPVAYLTHMTTPLGILCARAFVGEVCFHYLINDIILILEIIANFLKALCTHLDCYDLMKTITGNNCCLNASTVELFLEYELQPTSTKTMVHLAQTFRGGILAKYNYQNKEQNMEHYGQSEPPVYNISNVPHNLPLFVGYGGQDSISDGRDVDHLLNDLKFHETDKLKSHFVKDYAHIDFVMGISAKTMLYNDVISFFNLV
ncbi:triacylglycerol lipase 2-like protein [Carex littledalei]|uniref:Lipase n=1 Tax=Carex littledalei TaxID=544730 RepID=A0A833R297_9POAL|nr:triacylglycerol lipase 2-like protein [Carex littledalei]